MAADGPDHLAAPARRARRLHDGTQHPSHNDPLVRPWIDLITPPPRGPGLLDEGLKLLKAQARSGPASAAQDKVSRFQPQTINGVDGLNLRVMTPDETGASATGDPDMVTGSLSRLPPQVLQNLRDKGVRWIVVPDSADQGFPDADLASPSQHPKGWAGGADLGDASSMFVPPGYPSLRPNTVVAGTNPGRDHSYNVTLHETGHAHDYNSGMPSMSAAFKAAYGTDAPNMTRPDEATKEDLSDGSFRKTPTKIAPVAKPTPRASLAFMEATVTCRRIGQPCTGIGGIWTPLNDLRDRQNDGRPA